VSQDRFDRLEESGEQLPENVKTAIADIDRFEHLEIGQIHPVGALPAPAPAAEGQIICGHCGQYNEPGRDLCWACFKPLKAAPAPQSASDAGQEIDLVIDGSTYKSTDRDLPPDIGVLIDRIRKEGYSQELLVQWRNWRATRHVNMLPERSFDRGSTPGSDVEAFKGERVSVIRIDGKVYHSDDKDLPPQLKTVFDYIEKYGVTPDLMEHLRQYGDRVKFRPHTTGVPSDGDISFWNDVNSSSDPCKTMPGGLGSINSFWRILRELFFGTLRVR